MQKKKIIVLCLFTALVLAACGSDKKSDKKIPADVEKKDIKVTLNDSRLTISVTRNEPEEENGSYLLKERRYGTYSRSYYVGEDVKFKNISAKLNNGVLTLTIKKAKPEEKEDQFVEIL